MGEECGTGLEQRDGFWEMVRDRDALGQEGEVLEDQWDRQDQAHW